MNSWTPVQGEKRADAAVVLAWHVFRGAVIVDAAEFVKSAMFTHTMPIPTEGWIDAAKRQPCAADADENGCVMVYHKWDGYKVTGWRQFEWDKYIERWQRTPPPPENHRELRERF